MTTHESRYGREPITVPGACPTYAIRHRLGSVHVGTHPDYIAEMIRDTVASRRETRDTTWTAELEEAAVAFALWQHEENRAEYAYVMGSH